MLFVIVSIVIPLFVYYALPPVVGYLTRKPTAADSMLLVACLAYFISWYLPSPSIDGQNTAFTTHLIGGGVFSGLLWLYLKNHLRWQTSVALELLSLFTFVSALGVANELVELLLVELGLTNLSLADTSWDLLANTLGALLFWICYKLFWASRKYK